MTARPIQPSYRHNGLRRIEDLRGPPRVGTIYDVPVLRGTLNAGVEFDFPVIGRPHTDSGLETPHIHIDARFISEGALMAIGSLPHNPSGGRVLSFRDPIDVIGRGALPCLRPMPEWNAHNTWTHGKAISGASDHATPPVKCGSRLLCPHRGADVTQLRPDRRGFARCPLHGQLLDLR